MTREQIMQAVDSERARQTRLWSTRHPWGYGDCSSPGVPMVVKAAVLGEEAGEVLQAVLTAGPDKAAADPAVRTEVVQTLAVAWAILEAM